MAISGPLGAIAFLATPSYDAADYISWSGSNAVIVSEDGSENLNFFYI